MAPRAVGVTGPGESGTLLAPNGDAGWTLHVDGYDPLREGSVESRFAISNGLLGIRGVRATTPDSECRIETRLAVVKDMKGTR